MNDPELNNCCNCGLNENVINTFIKRKCMRKLCYTCSLIECSKNLLQFLGESTNRIFTCECCNEEAFNTEKDALNAYVGELSTFETINDNVELNFKCDNPICKSTQNVKYCPTCEVMYCQSCSVMHKKKDHKLYSKLEKEIIIQNVRECVIHNKKKDIFCKSCQEAICLECYKYSHISHKYENIDTLEIKIDVKIEEYMKELEENIKKTYDIFKSQMKKLEEDYQVKKNLMIEKYEKFDRIIKEKQRISMQMKEGISRNEKIGKLYLINQKKSFLKAVSFKHNTTKKEIIKTQEYFYNIASINQDNTGFGNNNFGFGTTNDTSTKNHDYNSAYLRWNKNTFFFKTNRSIAAMDKYKIKYVDCGTTPNSLTVVITTKNNEIVMINEGIEFQIKHDNFKAHKVLGSFNDERLICQTEEGDLYVYEQDIKENNNNGNDNIGFGNGWGMNDNNAFGGFGNGFGNGFGGTMENPFLNNNDYSWKKKDIGKHKIKDIRRGIEYFIAGITSDNDIITIGNNDNGRRGSDGDDSYSILQIPNEIIEKLECGSYHVVVLCSSGNVYGWGSNRYGQLFKEVEIIQKPTLIESNVKRISVSCDETAILSDRKVVIKGKHGKHVLNDVDVIALSSKAINSFYIIDKEVYLYNTKQKTQTSSKELFNCLKFDGFQFV